jgi:hypothetical protein
MLSFLINFYEQFPLFFPFSIFKHYFFYGKTMQKLFKITFKTLLQKRSLYKIYQYSHWNFLLLKKHPFTYKVSSSIYNMGKSCLFNRIFSWCKWKKKKTYLICIWKIAFIFQKQKAKVLLWKFYGKYFCLTYFFLMYKKKFQPFLN